MIVVATAGWSVPRISARHFPRDGTHLQRYAQVFAGVEVNTSAYREHGADTYAHWAALTPRRFRFAVKLPQPIIHEGRLRSARRHLQAFMAQIGGLRSRLGPLVVQLPPSLAFEAGVARRFFSLLRDHHDGDVVCEPRHPGWFEERPDALLVKYRIGRVAADPAVVPAAAEPGGWRGITYYRLHGSPRKYWSIYDRQRVSEWADALRPLKRAGRAWCVFDNTAASGAAGNALQMLSELGGRTKRSR